MVGLHCVCEYACATLSVVPVPVAYTCCHGRFHSFCWSSDIRGVLIQRRNLAVYCASIHIPSWCLYGKNNITYICSDHAG